MKILPYEHEPKLIYASKWGSADQCATPHQQISISEPNFSGLQRGHIFGQGLVGGRGDLEVDLHPPVVRLPFRKELVDERVGTVGVGDVQDGDVVGVGLHLGCEFDFDKVNSRDFEWSWTCGWPQLIGAFYELS